MWVLVAAFILVFVPGTLNAFDFVSGFGLFVKVGPFGSVFSLANGAVNILIFR